MKILGRMHIVCAKEEGQSANGNFWEKQTLIVEVQTGDRVVPVAIVFFGERRTKWLKDLKTGQLLEVAFAPESREYNGRWYTELVGFGVKPYVPAPSGGKIDSGGGGAVELPPQSPAIAGVDNDEMF